jgi:hypothetical protein
MPMTMKEKRIYTSADKSGVASWMKFPTLFTAVNCSLPE